MGLWHNLPKGTLACWVQHCVPLTGYGVVQADWAPLPPVVHQDLGQPCCQPGQGLVPLAPAVHIQEVLHTRCINVPAGQLEDE